MPDDIDSVLDDMEPNGTSTCRVTKAAAARVTFEPFIDEENRNFYMPLVEAQAIFKEVGL